MPSTQTIEKKHLDLPGLEFPREGWKTEARHKVREQFLRQISQLANLETVRRCVMFQRDI